MKGTIVPKVDYTIGGVQFKAGKTYNIGEDGIVYDGDVKLTEVSPDILDTKIDKVPSYREPLSGENKSRFHDAEEGELTIKQIRENGQCQCSPAIFDGTATEEMKDEVKEKGGMACRSGGEFITWAGSKRTCKQCAFFKNADE
jgi:hypothetical protein